MFAGLQASHNFPDTLPSASSRAHLVDYLAQEMPKTEQRNLLTLTTILEPFFALAFSALPKVMPSSLLRWHLDNSIHILELLEYLICSGGTLRAQDSAGLLAVPGGDPGSPLFVKNVNQE